MRELTNWRLRLTGKIRDFWRVRKSKSLHGTGGTVEKLTAINVSIFLMVGIFNIITGVTADKQGLYYLSYVAPFFIFSGIIIWKGSLKTSAILYAIMGIFTTFIGLEGNATGAVFLIFSFYIFNKPITNLIIAGLTLIAIVCKFMFLEFTISQAVNMILAYVYIFAIYYILIHPKPPTPKIIYCQNLDPETVKIIQYLADGYIYKEIAPLLELTEAAIRKRITRAREVMETKSTTELVIKCHKLDYIRYKIDKAPL